MVWAAILHKFIQIHIISVGVEVVVWLVVLPFGPVLVLVLVLALSEILILAGIHGLRGVLCAVSLDVVEVVGFHVGVGVVGIGLLTHPRLRLSVAVVYGIGRASISIQIGVEPMVDIQIDLPGKILVPWDEILTMSAHAGVGLDQPPDILTQIPFGFVVFPVGPLGTVGIIRFPPIILGNTRIPISIFILVTTFITPVAIAPIGIIPLAPAFVIAVLINPQSLDLAQGAINTLDTSAEFFAIDIFELRSQLLRYFFLQVDSTLDALIEIHQTLIEKIRSQHTTDHFPVADSISLIFLASQKFYP